MLSFALPVPQLRTHDRGYRLAVRGLSPSPTGGLHMTLKSIAAVFVVAVLPFAAQAQAAPTKAQAQQVVKMIGGDKAKTKIYCDMAKLGDQMDAADKKKDTKTVEALSKKMDAMTAQLGPDYVKLMDGLQAMKPDSNQAKEIADVMDGLDKLCGK
jgi:hypothetical protein